MYIVRDKKTREIIHKNPAPLSQKLSDKEIFFKFDSAKMEIGKVDGELPDYFKIDESGQIAELTLQEKANEGVFQLAPELKIDGEEIVEKSLVEKVNEGLVEIAHNQKVMGEEIIEKSLQEMLDEKLVSLDEVKAQKIDELSILSLSLRQTILSDFKIQNALMGIYDEKKVQNYKKTIEAFRNEFYRLKSEVEKAKGLKAIEAVEANYPSKIIGSSKAVTNKKKTVKNKKKA